MEFLDWLTLAVFLAFAAWWMLRALAEEKRRADAFCEKEARQTLLYERLLQKLEEY